MGCNRIRDKEGNFVLKKKQKDSNVARGSFGSSRPDSSGAILPTDPSQPTDPSALPEEWSPDQKIYPDDVNVEPESVGLQFNNPIAEKTEWEFADGDGIDPGNFQMTKIDPARLEFRTKTTWVGVFLILCGMVLGSFVVLRFAFGKISFEANHILSFLFSITAIGFGIFFSFASSTIVFDKVKGDFWQGWTFGHKKKIQRSARLADIEAIQLIDEWYGGEDSSMIYQLNLVLRDAGRINVFESKKHSKMRDAAKMLAEYLGKPVWDAT